VIHRADIHGAILDGVRNSPLIVLLTSARVEDMVQDGAGVTVTDSQGRRHTADALIGCDGVKPVIRDKLIGDAVRVSGHVVYRAVVPGDAAYPMLQYLAQGACMAIEDAVTLAAALERTDCDFDAAFSLYQQTRIPRIARVVLSAREMGRLYHAKGVERLVRSSLWKGRSNAGFYDALEWLYGWKPETCLDA
jgi:2-polyprenyl-6-methoxyphenol hydroxylase-like FAD-dependent oxidoreductase